MIPTASERVAKGVEYLDANYEGWRDRLSLDRLDMNHQQKCVLGQIVPSTWGYSGFILGAQRAVQGVHPLLRERFAREFVLLHGFIGVNRNDNLDLEMEFAREVRNSIPMAPVLLPV